MSAAQAHKLFGTSALTSVSALLKGLDGIDQRGYDFPEPLEVGGAKRLGTMSVDAQKLHVASIMALKQVAEAERALATAKSYAEAVNALFDQAVQEQFPADIRVVQVPGGVAVEVESALYYGAGWNVYSADPSKLREALRASQQHRRGDGEVSGMPRNLKDLMDMLRRV